LFKKNSLISSILDPYEVLETKSKSHNLTLNLLNKHYIPPTTLHLMMSSNGASARWLLWKNLFTFCKCSTYLSKNIDQNRKKIMKSYKSVKSRYSKPNWKTFLHLLLSNFALTVFFWCNLPYLTVLINFCDFFCNQGVHYFQPVFRWRWDLNAWIVSPQHSPLDQGATPALTFLIGR